MGRKKKVELDKLSQDMIQCEKERVQKYLERKAEGAKANG